MYHRVECRSFCVHLSHMKIGFVDSILNFKKKCKTTEMHFVVLFAEDELLCPLCRLFHGAKFGATQLNGIFCCLNYLKNTHLFELKQQQKKKDIK